MAQKEYKTFSISPVFINPSIMEGEMAVPGVLSPDAAIPIVRFAHANTSPPTIVGDVAIPSTLRCSEGTWVGSPLPTYTYQWYLNGEAILGETNNTFITYEGVENLPVTCVVTASSPFSPTQAITTNEIIPLLFEDVSNFEFNAYMITGLNRKNSQTLIELDYMIVTGMSQINTLTNTGLDGYIITGM